MAVKIAINGFGRIGRLAARILSTNPAVELVAVNDLTDAASLVHLIKYDSIHGRFSGSVSLEGSKMLLNGHSISCFAQPNPADLPWKELGIDIVLECSGRFRDKETASKHLEAGAKKVLISAPAKGDIPTIVLGVNNQQLSPDAPIISNASCTTNCLAPMAKVLNDNFGIENGFMTTVHAYTADQNLQDGPHKGDMRRARAAAANIVPTTTNAASALSKVMPEMAGKLTGGAFRVPVVNGSITDLVCNLQTTVTAEDINRAFEQAANGYLSGILEFCKDPVVSSDIVGNPHSCIFDSLETRANGRLVKISGWYDNEFGYACRLAELAVKVGSFI